MKYSAIILSMFLSCFLLSNATYAQLDDESINVSFSVPEVALIDIEHIGFGILEFTLLPASETGASPAVQQNNTEELWINYSSAIGKYSPSRSIVAQISDGTLPQGLVLYVQASNYSGTGDGILGFSAGKVVLGNEPRQVITGIGSGYTGNGVGNGHLLNFWVDITDMEEVTTIESTDFTILYTLTDD